MSGYRVGQANWYVWLLMLTQVNETVYELYERLAKILGNAGCISIVKCFLIKY